MSVSGMPIVGLGRRRPELDLEPLRAEAWIGSLYGEGLKRLVDVVLAGLALVAFSPIFAVLAVLVKLDGGSVFFRQRRVGKDGVEFWFYKFRSMVVDAESRRGGLVTRNEHGQLGVTFKIKNDPRITKVGRFLRKSSLDELPQFWNVLRGDMSLIGPRPALPAEVARYSSEERQRLSVLPGLTYLWQVKGRADLPFDQQVILDLEYIARRSLWLDLSLLFRTLSAMLSGRGVY